MQPSLLVDNACTALPTPASASRKTTCRQIQTFLHDQARPFRAHGTVVLDHDECQTVYVLLEGWLALSKSLPEGQVQIIDFALPGDIVHTTSADGRTSSLTVEALTGGMLAAFTPASWQGAQQAFPELRDRERRFHAASQARLAERMLRLGKGNADTRVSYALFELYLRLNPAQDAGPFSFTFPLTQQKLGEFVGLSSVHICRTMRRMVANGVIVTKNQDILVRDCDRLAQMAGVEFQTLKDEIVPRGPGACTAVTRPLSKAV